MTAERAERAETPDGARRGRPAEQAADRHVERWDEWRTCTLNASFVSAFACRHPPLRGGRVERRQAPSAVSAVSAV